MVSVRCVYIAEMTVCYWDVWMGLYMLGTLIKVGSVLVVISVLVTVAYSTIFDYVLFCRRDSVYVARTWGAYNGTQRHLRWIDYCVWLNGLFSKAMGRLQRYLLPNLYLVIYLSRYILYRWIHSYYESN